MVTQLRIWPSAKREFEFSLEKLLFFINLHYVFLKTSRVEFGHSIQNFETSAKWRELTVNLRSSLQPWKIHLLRQKNVISIEFLVVVSGTSCLKSLHFVRTFVVKISHLWRLLNLPCLLRYLFIRSNQIDQDWL